MSCSVYCSSACLNAHAPGPDGGTAGCPGAGPDETSPRGPSLQRPRCWAGATGPSGGDPLPPRALGPTHSRSVPQAAARTQVMAAHSKLDAIHHIQCNVVPRHESVSRFIGTVADGGHAANDWIMGWCSAACWSCSDTPGSVALLELLYGVQAAWSCSLLPLTRETCTAWLAREASRRLRGTW